MFNDKDMIYNEALDQYVLTKNYVLNTLYLDEHVEVELQSNERLNRLLVEVSDDIYRFIYRYTRHNARAAKNHLLKNDEKIRALLKRAMLAQTRYYLRSGGGLLKDMVGVDLERSRLINLDQLRGERHISAHAYDFLSEDWRILYTGTMVIPNVEHTSST